MTEAWRIAVETIDAKQGRGIVVLDLRGLTPVADRFIVATAEAARHLDALAEAVVEAVRCAGAVGAHPRIEGTSRSGWVIVDLGADVVHLFDEETRRRYDLEGVWADAEVIGWR